MVVVDLIKHDIIDIETELQRVSEKEECDDLNIGSHEHKNSSDSTSSAAIPASRS